MHTQFLSLHSFLLPLTHRQCLDCRGLRSMCWNSLWLIKNLFSIIPVLIVSRICWSIAWPLLNARLLIYFSFQHCFPSSKTPSICLMSPSRLTIPNQWRHLVARMLSYPYDCSQLVSCRTTGLESSNRSVSSDYP